MLREATAHVIKLVGHLVQGDGGFVQYVPNVVKVNQPAVLIETAAMLKPADDERGCGHGAGHDDGDDGGGGIQMALLSPRGARLP